MLALPLPGTRASITLSFSLIADKNQVRRELGLIGLNLPQKSSRASAAFTAFTINVPAA